MTLEVFFLYPLAMLEKLSPHEAVRVYRERLGLTQMELGQRVGVSDKQISAIETGKSSVSLAVAVRLQEVLGIPVSEWSTPEAA